MSNDIVNNYIDEFNDNLVLKLQQLNSRFRGTMTESTHEGEGASVVDQISSVTSERRTTRHGPKPVIETPHDRRWVYPTDFDWGDIVDNEDKLRTRIRPEGAYTKNGIAAIARDLDDEVIGAFFGTAKTGVRGGTSTTHSNQVAVGVGSSADTGLNTKKLLSARELIIGAEVDIEDPDNQLWCAISAKYERQLLEQIKVASGDYNKPVFGEDGKTLRHWFGINFVMTERLDTDTNSDYRVPFWAASGMHIGIWDDIKGNIVQRNDLKRDPFHVTTSGTFGATRIEEARVVEIICDPT